SGADVEIEQRPAAELFQLEGEALLEDEIAGRYPAFDVTPSRLIARLVGFEAGYTPEEFRKKYQSKASPGTGARKQAADQVLVYGVPKRSEYDAFARTLKLEKAAHILVAEMRPELSGVYAVAKELRERNVPAEIITDNMMGTFFAQGAIRRLYLFYTEIGGAGPVGICGSQLAALLAHAHAVPIEL